MAHVLIHPGEILANELNELEMTAAQLARDLGLSAGLITQFLDGQRGFDVEILVHLGQWLSTGPELWLNSRMQYERRP